MRGGAAAAAAAVACCVAVIAPSRPSTSAPTRPPQEPAPVAEAVEHAQAPIPFASASRRHPRKPTRSQRNTPSVHYISADSARNPEHVARVFAETYINWDARTLPGQRRRLARLCDPRRRKVVVPPMTVRLATAVRRDNAGLNGTVVRASVRSLGTTTSIVEVDTRVRTFGRWTDSRRAVTGRYRAVLRRQGIRWRIWTWTVASWSN